MKQYEPRHRFTTVTALAKKMLRLLSDDQPIRLRKRDSVMRASRRAEEVQAETG